MKILCLLLAIVPLCAELKVLAFSGSTRADSYNKKLVMQAAETVREMGAEVTLIDLADYPMPFYNADLEAEVGMPEYAAQFRELLVESDAVLIASPEYNGSVPAILKNAIDWASRDNGDASRDAFKGKKFAIMSASPGRGGGSRGLTHLRNIIENVGGEVVSMQVTIPQAHLFFSEKKMGENLALKEEMEQLLVN